MKQIHQHCRWKKSAREFQYRTSFDFIRRGGYVFTPSPVCLRALPLSTNHSCVSCFMCDLCVTHVVTPTTPKQTQPAASRPFCVTRSLRLLQNVFMLKPHSACR